MLIPLGERRLQEYAIPHPPSLMLQAKSEQGDEGKILAFAEPDGDFWHEEAEGSDEIGWPETKLELWIAE